MTSKTIASIVGRRDWTLASAPSVQWTFPLPEQYVGVELEVDRDSTTADSTVFPDDRILGFTWQRKSDGSLASGYEYVLRSPLAGKQLADAVFKLFSGGTRVHRTYTGSTHIHLDMTDGVPVEALRVLLLMTYAFEPYMYAVGDITRQWCGYANRLVAAPSDVLEAILGSDDLRNFNRAVENAGRYYGLNLCALSKYGSVEFRYFPTAESPEELLSWINLCQKFKKAAVAIGTVDKLLEMMKSKEGYNELLDTYFDSDADGMRKECPYSRVRSLMQKALIIAQSTGREPSSYRMPLIGSRFRNILTKYGYRAPPESVQTATDATSVKVYFMGRDHTTSPDPQSLHSQDPQSVHILVRFTGDVFAITPNTPWGVGWVYLPDLREYDQNMYDAVLSYEDSVLEVFDAYRDNCTSYAEEILTNLFHPEESIDEEEEEEEYEESDLDPGFDDSEEDEL